MTSEELNHFSFQHWRRCFNELPIVSEGHSRVVRLIDEETVIIVLKPALYSIMENKVQLAIETDRIRLRCSEVFWRVLKSNGVSLPIITVGEDYYISRRVNAPPIEVVVKAAHVGTPKHIYKGMHRARTRDGNLVTADGLHPPYVRFDWRNPLPDRDECMPIGLADRFIDTVVAQKTVLRAFDIMSYFLIGRGIILLDVCFFVSTDGLEIFGEISPDCLRFRWDSTVNEDDLATYKDLDVIIGRWSQFLRLIEVPATLRSLI